MAFYLLLLHQPILVIVEIQCFRFEMLKLMSVGCIVMFLLLPQLSTEVMQLYSDDDEVEKAFSGENVKIKLKNVEEEASIEQSSWLAECDSIPFCVLFNAVKDCFIHDREISEERLTIESVCFYLYIFELASCLIIMCFVIFSARKKVLFLVTWNKMTLGTSNTCAISDDISF